MRSVEQLRSQSSVARLRETVYIAAGVIGCIVLLRLSAMTEGSWAFGALLYAAGAMGMLWLRLFRGKEYGAFFACRTGARVFSLILTVLFGIGAVVLCALMARAAFRLVLCAALVFGQLLGVRLLDAAAGALSRRMRTGVLVLLQALLWTAMLLVTAELQQQAVGGSLLAFAIGGAALAGCGRAEPAEEPVLQKEEELPASFALWLQTVSAGAIAAVFCGFGVAVQTVLCMGVGALLTVSLAVLALAGFCAACLIRSGLEYAVLQRGGVWCWCACVLLGLLGPDNGAVLVLALLLYGLGCALMAAGLLLMRRPWGDLLSIDERTKNGAEVRSYFHASLLWAMLPAGLTLFAGLLAAVYFLPRNNRVFTPALSLLSLLLALVFFARCWLLSTRQPLDRAYEAKLRRYLKLSSPEENPPLARRIRSTLIEPYTRSAGFWMIKTLFRPFFPARFIGADRIDPQSDTPAVLVCNHLEIYGPIITQLHLPVPVRTWMINNMVELELTEENLSGAVDKIFRIFSERTRRRICHLLARPVCWALNCVDHITVYRGGSRDVIRTIRDTVEAMQCGDNILLFPENTSAPGETGAYKIGEVSAFFSGFFNIASSYYDKTGECVTFYPIFADKKKRRIYAGEGIEFDPDKPKAEEKKRIVGYLHDTMSSMAEAASLNGGGRT